MTDTANLGLPCIEGSQAQKHITHNDALRILDTLVQLAVLDRDLIAPPGSLAEGQCWIVKATATGAWTGHDNAVAAWQDGAWQFSTPQTGWLAYVVDEGALLAWSGSAWVDAMAALTSLNNMTLLGVGTTADATNPFSAKLNNILWVAKTVAESGDGDLRWKMSKESPSNTLSMLFQDNYSGRAELGLTGDDDFHVRVSPDGSTWMDALVIDKSSGLVTLSQGLANGPAPFDAMACVNLALNADHIVSQENGATAVTGIGSAGGVATYITDQWAIRAKGSLRVSGQRINSIALAGINYALRTTITTTQSSLGTGDYLQVSQPIEGLRTLRLGFGYGAALSLAVGIYVRSSVTGTFAVELSNSARDRSICKLVTIGAADTWTWVPFSGAPGSGQTAFPGDTSGTWLIDAGVGLNIGITLAAGASLQGTADAWSAADIMTTSAQTNLAAAASATFDVTGLCVFGGNELPGTSQVPLVMRQFDESERLCQRYYFRRNSNGTADIIGLGQAVSTTLAFPPPIIFPIPMRVAPAVNLSSVSHFSLTGGSGTGNACTSGDYNIVSRYSAGSSGGFGVASGLAGAGYATEMYFNSVSGWIEADARL